MKIKIVSLLFLLLSMNCFSQSPAANFSNDDVQVVLHETMINKVLNAIGNFSDTSTYSILFFKGTYKWTVIDPKIELKANGKALFKCEVQVEAGFLSYRNEVIGDADVWYDKEKNLINIKIQHGLFEIYTHIFGAKMHITDVDLAQYYTTPLTFEGPLTLSTSMDFTMPDNTKKTIYAIPYDCNLTVEEHKIVVKCEMQFLDKDPTKR